MREDKNTDLYQEISVENEDIGTVLMEQPFNPSEINIDFRQPTISNLIERMRQDPPEIDLFTDFQRRGDLWSPQQQSRLIESILIKFPLPAFYFDGSDPSKWLVVDGLQRLSSLRNFIIDRSLILEGLEFLPTLNGLSYDILPRHLKRTMDEAQITAHIINPGTPVKVKYNIFKRINTGGLVLEPQEIRHALNQGIPANFVKELANLDEFTLATGNKISPSRMLDREFATRFVAFYLADPGGYKPDLDSFLNDAMAKIGDLSESERKIIKMDFCKAMEYSNKIFGDWAFRKADQYPEKRKPINKSLFEVWSVLFSKMDAGCLARLDSKKERLMLAFKKICSSDKSFMNSISQATGDKQRVIERFSKVNTIVTEVLND